MKKPLLFAAIAVLLVACATPKDFEYRDVRNMKINSVGIGRSELGLDMIFFNPNGGVDLRKIDCDVYVNNVLVGNIHLDTVMHIPRKAEFTLPTRIQIDFQAVLKNGLNMLFNKDVLINVKGTARAGRAGFFRTVPFDYSGTQKLTLFN